MTEFNFADNFEALADAFPDRLVVSFRDRRFTYGQFRERARRLANYLSSRGLGEVTPRGDDAPVFEAQVGADGRFSLAEAMPKGNYELRAYHQDLQRVTKPRLVALQSFEVAATSGTVTVNAKRR